MPARVCIERWRASAAARRCQPEIPRTVDDDVRHAILSVPGSGDPIDALGALDEAAYSATVVAVTPSALEAIGTTDFRRSLQANFNVTRYVVRELVQRLRRADRGIESLDRLGAAGRVVRLLRVTAPTTNAEQVVSSGDCRQDIARMIGASREMVSRVGRDVELRGLVEEYDGRIVLRAAGSP